MRASSSLFVFVAAALISALAGCSGSDGGPLSFEPEADAGGSEGDSSLGDGSGDGADAGGGCKSSAECDDGIACTIDTCVFGACQYAAGSPSACASGQVCEVGKGCVSGIPCSTDAQCETSYGDDPCKTNIRCDGPSATCQFSILDNDGDGHPPIVCGGGDCNDADPNVFPGAVESCNGRDDNCNGAIDDNATCPGGGVCQGGQCACPPQNICNGVCVDFQADAMNCGGCGIRCGGGEACEKGACKPSTSCKSPALFLMQDVSGSMDPDRWPAAKEGIEAFVKESSSAGLGVGIGYFPVLANGAIPSSCQNDADCGAYGPCFLNICFGGYNGNPDSCDVADYQKPAVAIAKLPGNVSAITTSLAAMKAGGGSPLAVPLEGAIHYARDWAKGNANSKAAVVLITDNLPNICGSADSLTKAIEAAQAGLLTTPSVETFVIRWAGADGTDDEWKQLAQAGGGASNAYPVGSAANLQAALGAIRSAVSTCP